MKHFGVRKQRNKEGPWGSVILLKIAPDRPSTRPHFLEDLPRTSGTNQKTMLWKRGNCEHTQNPNARSWKDGSVVKTEYCSHRGHELGSQYPHQGTHNSLLFQQIWCLCPTPSIGTCTGMHIPICRWACIHITFFLNLNHGSLKIYIYKHASYAASSLVRTQQLSFVWVKHIFYIFGFTFNIASI